MVSAGLLMSGLACLDVLLTVFCARFPLLFYLLAGAIGAGIGTLIRRKGRGWLDSHPTVKKSLKGLALTGCFFGLLSAGFLTFSPTNWQTKCSWRHCGRALSFSLLDTPYPVGTPSCRALHMCANEYPLNPAQHAELDRLIKLQGCPEP